MAAAAISAQLPSIRSSILKDFKGLKVWQIAHALTLDVYQVTGALPKEEQ
jgi:hypothetical protein